jgi:hypothetical protein
MTSMSNIILLWRPGSCTTQLHENFSMPVGDMLWTKLEKIHHLARVTDFIMLMTIISVTILKQMMIKWSLFIFSYFYLILTPICNLYLSRWDLNFACDTPAHNGLHLCEVILKCLHGCRSFAPDKPNWMTSLCYLDLWTRDQVHAHNRAFHSGEHFCEVLSQPPSCM